MHAQNSCSAQEEGKHREQKQRGKRWSQSLADPQGNALRTQLASKRLRLEKSNAGGSFQLICCPLSFVAIRSYALEESCKTIKVVKIVFFALSSPSWHGRQHLKDPVSKLVQSELLHSALFVC